MQLFLHSAGRHVTAWLGRCTCIQKIKNELSRFGIVYRDKQTDEQTDDRKKYNTPPGNAAERSGNTVRHKPRFFRGFGDITKGPFSAPALPRGSSHAAS